MSRVWIKLLMKSDASVCIYKWESERTNHKYIAYFYFCILKQPVFSIFYNCNEGMNV